MTAGANAFSGRLWKSPDLPLTEGDKTGSIRVPFVSRDTQFAVAGRSDRSEKDEYQGNQAGSAGAALIQGCPGLLVLSEKSCEQQKSGMGMQAAGLLF